VKFIAKILQKDQQLTRIDKY